MTPGICNALHDDHMATVRLLEDLETALTRAGRKKPPAPDDAGLARLLDELVAPMRQEITDHFAFEEEHLFPRVEQLGDTPMLTILKGEHNTIRPLAERLAGLIAASRRDGFDADAWAELYDLGLELAERETFHIQKEEMGFLPLLGHMLAPDEDRALAAAYADAKARS
ncbi:MAG: hemerythrin domain-containing protein [Alphaproteobacteria bacterium]|nr:hemerythrin domain-containing protein [Alphaproteobacteria bacterium]